MVTRVLCCGGMGEWLLCGFTKTPFRAWDRGSASLNNYTHVTRRKVLLVDVRVISEPAVLSCYVLGASDQTYQTPLSVLSATLERGTRTSRHQRHTPTTPQHTPGYSNTTYMRCTTYRHTATRPPPPSTAEPRRTTRPGYHIDHSP